MDVRLDQGVIPEWLVEPELAKDRRMVLGDVLVIQDLLAKCQGWIGDAPFSLDAESTAKRLNGSTDEWQRAARPEFADRFVLVTFGVQDLGGILTPKGVGLELVFRNDKRKLNAGQRIHIHSVFPSARFQVYQTTTTSGQVAAKGSLNTEVTLAASAELVPPGNLTPILPSLSDAKAQTHLEGSASVSTTVDYKKRIVWFSTSYASVVEAIGEGDTRALWVFHQPHGPLIGKPLETVTGLTVGRKRTELEFDARMFIVFKIGPYPVRCYSSWIRLSTQWK